MHLLEQLHRNVRTIAMPSAMVLGAAVPPDCGNLETASHQMITPTLIFLMLFVTFCRVSPQTQMKPSMLHVLAAALPGRGLHRGLSAAAAAERRRGAGEPWSASWLPWR